VARTPRRPRSAGRRAEALEAKDNEFTPKTITAAAGDITIEMENTGVAPHTFTNADLKVDVNVDAGKTGDRSPSRARSPAPTSSSASTTSRWA
jgi:plastocyanin